MNIKDLLDKCEDAYLEEDFERLIELCDEILKTDPVNQRAIGYKSVACCFLNRPQNALEILESAIRLYPDNYYLKNNLAMVYYDLGDYEKSLKYCEEGLKIKDFDWLFENKIKALLKLDRVDEAIEFYENAPVYFDICDLLIEAGKYSEALEYYSDDYFKIIDKIKEANPREAGEHYISWIYKIIFKHDTEVCPDCGGELLPIVMGLPTKEMLKKEQNGEFVLGGCVIGINDPNYHCKECHHEFKLGYEGLEIEASDLNDYIEYKIEELLSKLKKGSFIVIKSLDSLKKELKGFDEKEFNAFIDHLKEINLICEPKKGYIKLFGFKNRKCIKEYLDEGKFAAPKWLVYPQLSSWTIGWRMGAGEHYAMNEPWPTDEFKKLFPMPKYWNFSFSRSPYKPHPLLGYFWSEDGKPAYPNSSEGIKVNDWINLDDEREFQSDSFIFKSVEHAELLSKFLHFEKCERNADLDILRSLELSREEEKIWEVYRYSVLLNAGYFKIMQDEKLKQKLLETGDDNLIYSCDDAENLFGRALMELRDEIKRLCKNEDKIDWGYTEYLKIKPWDF